MKSKIMSIFIAIGMALSLTFPAISAQWGSAWVEVENGYYKVSYFPGKRLIAGRCYCLKDGLLHSEAPNQRGDCSEG